MYESIQLEGQCYTFRSIRISNWVADNLPFVILIYHATNDVISATANQGTKFLLVFKLSSLRHPESKAAWHCSTPEMFISVLYHAYIYCLLNVGDRIYQRLEG